MEHYGQAKPACPPRGPLIEAVTPTTSKSQKDVPMPDLYDFAAFDAWRIG